MSSESELVILAVRGAISMLSKEQSEACFKLAEIFRVQIKEAGDVVGPMAFALVGAELQDKIPGGAT